MLSQEDVKQLKKYYEKDAQAALLIHHLEDSYRMNLSRISHEIRNPVTLINSFLQLTQNHHPEVSSFETWEPVMENMEYLKQLLEELSDYNNSHALHKAQISLATLLRTLISDCQPSLLPVQIHFEKTSAIPTAYFDTTKIRAAVLNLIRNASEALKGKSNGRIDVMLSFDGSFFHIQVINNGPEIPAENLENLFEPFITHKKEGTGLGLAIVQNTVLAHKGTVSVSSNPQETCFTIALPLCYE